MEDHLDINRGVDIHRSRLSLSLSLSSAIFHILEGKDFHMEIFWREENQEMNQDEGYK